MDRDELELLCKILLSRLGGFAVITADEQADMRAANSHLCELAGQQPGEKRLILETSKTQGAV